MTSWWEDVHHDLGEGLHHSGKKCCMSYSRLCILMLFTTTCRLCTRSLQAYSCQDFQIMQVKRNNQSDLIKFWSVLNHKVASLLCSVPSVLVQEAIGPKDTFSFKAIAPPCPPKKTLKSENLTFLAIKVFFFMYSRLYRFNLYDAFTGLGVHERPVNFS